jgi:ribonuclease HI
MKNGNWSGKAFALGQIRGGSWEAEARAIIEAFRLAGDLLLPHHKVVEVCSDHMGLVNGYNGFGRVRQAQDHMFQNVLQMGAHLTARGVEVKVTWVKGHDVYAGNEMADYLARLGARRSAQGHDGDAWNNPNLGELDVSDQALSTMSTNAESVALHRLLTKDERVVRREERRIHREKTRVQRRERKLQLRAERKKMDADAKAAADLRLT